MTFKEGKKIIKKNAKVSLICFFMILIFGSFGFGYTVQIDTADYDFQYKRTVTIQGSQVPGGPHNNFPMLFDSDVSNLKDELKQSAGKVQSADGYDIVFATGDGIEILKHEIEEYNPSDGTYLAWVKVDLTGGDQTIYLYYGSTDITDEDPDKDTQHVSAVWDDGGSNYYKGVWHLSETSGAISETGNAKNGGNSGSASITHGLTINEDDVVIAIIHANNESNTITDNNGAYSFTQAIQEQNVGQSSRYAIFYRVAGSSEPSSYSWTLDNIDSWSLLLRVFSGVDTSSVWDVAPSTSTRDYAGSGSTATAPSMTTSNDGAMGIVVFISDSTISWSNPTNGYGTEVENNTRSAGSYIRIWGTAGATGATSATLSSSNDWLAHQFALKPATVLPIKDSTQYGNHGTDENSPTLGAAGKIDNAVSFDGTNDRRINCGTDGSLDISSGTLEAWIYPIGWGAGGWGTIIDRGGSSSNWGYQFGVTTAEDLKMYGDGSIVGSGSNTVSLDSWQYVVVVLTGSVAKFYVNGNPENQPGWDLAAKGTATFYIAWCEESAGEEFNGIIDEVRVSNYQRSENWIKTCFYNQDSPSSFYQIGGELTDVELVSFTAKPLNSAVILEWKTATEIDNEGFNILRSEEGEGEYEKINPYFILSRGIAGFGTEYSFTDYDVENGTTYYYLLEDIDFYGVSKFHGPVSVTPNDIIPIWPDEWEILPLGSLIFSWASSGNYSYKIEISTNPSFPSSATYSFPERGWTSDLSLWIRPEQWEMIHRKAQESGGQLFWRVCARSEDGSIVYSDQRRLVVERPKLPIK